MKNRLISISTISLFFLCTMRCVFLLVGTIFGNAVIEENLLILGDQDVVIPGANYDDPNFLYILLPSSEHGVCDQQVSVLASIRLIVCYSRGRPFSVVADSIFVSSFGRTGSREFPDSLIDIPLLRNLELPPQIPTIFSLAVAVCSHSQYCTSVARSPVMAGGRLGAGADRT
jgi:hypothetical protein